MPKGKELFFTKELAKGMFGCRTTASTLDCVDCPVAEHCKEVVDICHNAEGQPDAGVTIKPKESIKTPRTYPELLGAIERAITPKIVDFCKITSLPDAIHQALHYDTQTLELISEFVGYRHVELLERHAKEQGKCQ